MSWGPFYEKNFGKKSHNAEKTERVDPLGLFNIHFVAKHQKIEGGTLWGKNNFSGKKDSQCRKKTERGTLWSRPVWYVTRENPFWFSSLGQMVQFGAIIFCRTFVELFWSVQVVFEKTLTKSHDYSRLFSKEKRRLKKGGGKVS